MARIDPQTVERIISAANIVEVVSDYVELRRRGSGYVGLCPFHNERTPSFTVTPSRGICKCFGCGKGGGPVNFLMQIENMTYVEALRHLAKKYNIPIKERELTPEEQQHDDRRRAMLAANEWACGHWHDNLLHTDEGRDVGLTYFRHRGVSDEMIERFALGYSVERPRDELEKASASAGIRSEVMCEVGLLGHSQKDGGLYDRFRGRVIYPLKSLSGRVIAFGGRILDKTKSPAKYVNSPESLVYHKSDTLYGLFQGRQAIARRQKAILVEGYMDVISMHQRGMDHAVASSGTALTTQQVALLHRLTTDVTVAYDRDAAGIHASLRAIDMLLDQDMQPRLVSLPPGDDPDSYAQTHTAEEVEAYFRDHEVDFVTFKCDTLLPQAQSDPGRLTAAVTDILTSIRRIKDPVGRQLYIQLLSPRVSVSEEMLAERLARMPQPVPVGGTVAPAPQPESEKEEAKKPQPPAQANQKPAPRAEAGCEAQYKRDAEAELMRYIVRYGAVDLCEVYNEDAPDDAEPQMMTVTEYVDSELSDEGPALVNDACRRLLAQAVEIVRDMWPQARRRQYESIDREADAALRQGQEEIADLAADLADIQVREKALTERVEAFRQRGRAQAAADFVFRQLLNSPDDVMRRIAMALGTDSQPLSRIHSRYADLVPEQDQLTMLVPRAIVVLRMRHVEWLRQQLRQQLAEAQRRGDQEASASLMAQIAAHNALLSSFAHHAGDRTILP